MIIKNMTSITSNSKKSLKKVSPASWIRSELYKDVRVKKGRKKVKMDDFEVVKYDEYDKILEFNYNVKQLKEICSHYKIIKGGNKEILIKRVYNYLKYSYYANKIQKIMRGNLTRYLFKLKGAHDIKNSINDTDFFTLESIKEIPFERVLSYKDKDNNVYVYDIRSLYHLFKENPSSNNPYNRKRFKGNIKKRMKKIRRISRALGYKLNMDLNIDDDDMSDTDQLELKITSVFQKIDKFGFITDRNWFKSLNASQFRKFFAELTDVWNYRANLSPASKHSILPNTPHLFSTIHYSLFTREITYIRKKILKVIDTLISEGVDEQSRSLGAFYVLGSLTTVNYNAANTLPWLYESFAHLN